MNDADKNVWTWVMTIIYVMFSLLFLFWELHDPMAYWMGIAGIIFLVVICFMWDEDW